MNTPATSQTVQTFMDFFSARGHHRISSSSLVPPPDDPVLFTSAGMQPLTPYLLGKAHPLGRRLAGRQRCLRTTDLAEVGDPVHLTLFEMLGSWSLGDYDGPQSLRWGYELLTGGFGIDPGRLHATVFGGDDQVGADTRSLDTWGELGLPVEPLGEDNWWSNGPSGPCGPDSEIFVWTGDGPPVGTPSTSRHWMELWNHVTMRYYRHGDGSLEPLPRPSVDTGMGLERLMMARQGAGSVYRTGIFQPWLSTLPGLWPLDERSLRLVTDHLRASVVITGDGVRPANGGRGYVLRRLLRRALTTLWRVDGSATLAGLPSSLVTGTLAHLGQDSDPGLVRDVLLTEQRRFAGLLTRGRRVLRGLTTPLTHGDLRYLHQTHGLPPELVRELLGGEQATG